MNQNTRILKFICTGCKSKTEFVERGEYHLIAHRNCYWCGNHIIGEVEMSVKDEIQALKDKIAELEGRLEETEFIGIEHIPPHSEITELTYERCSDRCAWKVQFKLNGKRCVTVINDGYLHLGENWFFFKLGQQWAKKVIMPPAV